ncbi:scarecrow-like protein 30 [Fagus crenata]
MDTLFEEISGPGFMKEFKFNHDSDTPLSKQDVVNRFQVNHEFFHQPLLPTNPQQDLSDSNSSPSSSGSTSLEGDPSDSGEISHVTLKYIKEILMEEDLGDKPCMLQDCLALQAAEKSFYEVLGQKYPPSTGQLSHCFDQNIDTPDRSSSVDSSNSYTIAIADNLVESNWVYDQEELKSFGIQNSLFDSAGNTLLLPDSFSETHSAKSLPNGNQEIIDLESTPSGPPKHSTERNRRQTSPNGSSRRKNHQREESDYLEEGRSNKHSVVYARDSEPLEMYDKILLCPGADHESTPCSLHDPAGNGASRKLQHNGKTSKQTTRSKKQGDKGEIVDFWSLLTQCANAVASSDQRTTNELLKQIRQHSSQYGDGNQRLAYYFANALESRLAGTKIPGYTAAVSNGTSAADILKAYQVYVTACPFKRMSNFFANRTIRRLAQTQKATRLHIIDFGITYGFQWPCLIQRLSERPGGPPKLRITGIELPQPGFRPAERVEETGRRLENYCKRFNVPFEYNVIAQKWETIQLEDLKIDKDELTVVNCMYRLKHIPDETVAMHNPRDSVLKLIKRINPDLFVHGVVNGTYNAPFFVTRFREALFHFSSLFDMFDANVPREDEQRSLFEKEIFGRDAMNVIACEGLERVERPETYKQWQVRNLRAGFRQLPLDQELLQKVKKTVKLEYHKDFVVDVDGQWILQGWKGRILHALSCWKPT